MASPASTIGFSTPPMAVCTSQLRQLNRPFLMHVRNHSLSATCSVKLPRMKEFNKPSVFKTRISYSKEDLWAFFPDPVKNFPWENIAVQSKEKLWAFFPDPVKNFPWENVAVQSKEKLWALLPDSVKYFPWDEAGNVAAQQLLIQGKEALKWSLIGLFVLNSISDIIYSVSINKELAIPFGLFVGCMITDFLKETSRELLLTSQVRDETWHLLGFSCFFVLLKIISICFPVGLRVFLCHVANGGILQVLWHYKSLVEQDKSNTGNLALQDNQMSGAAEDQPVQQS